MILDTFFRKFDQFADAPDAVAKMRELVLQLAVQGKLVSQNPRDEKASSLLSRIGKTKESLMSDRTIRRQETAPIDPTEAPFSIPQSWVWTRLGEIANWGSGSTPSRGNTDLYDGGIAWLKSGELNDNQALAGSEETVTEKALTTGSFRRNKPGDVLLAMYGATIGKVAILAEPAVTNQAICGCTPFDGVFNRYLFSYLLSQRARFHSASEGGAQPNISKVKIVAFPFPLPPLAEQKRIVTKVDELMALCDRLEAQQQERDKQASALARASLARFAEAPTPANLNLLFHKSYSISPADLRKAILTLAVQGKLVPQVPMDEPAKNWFRKFGKSKPVDEATFGEPPFVIPESWIWLRVESAFEVAGGIQKTPHRAPRDNPFPYLGVGNVYRGRLDLTNIKEFELDPGEIDRRRLESGDLLIIEGNGSFNEIGRCAKWRGEIKDCVTQNHIIRCRPCDERISDYVLLFLNSPNGMEIMQRLAITSSGLYSLSVGKIRQIEIPIPPLAEQRRIVAKVDQLMALVDQLETQFAASRAASKKLLEALVAEIA